MSTKLNFGRDVQGYNAYAPAFATDNYSATIPISTATTLTVPSNYQTWIAVFNCTPGASIWVTVNQTSAIPAGATFASTTSILNPGSRTVYAGDVISVITDSAGGCDVSIALYASC